MKRREIVTKKNALASEVSECFAIHARWIYTKKEIFQAGRSVKSDYPRPVRLASAAARSICPTPGFPPIRAVGLLADTSGGGPLAPPGLGAKTGGFGLGGGGGTPFEPARVGWLRLLGEELSDSAV